MLKMETETNFNTWYEAGKTAGKLRLGIHIYSGPADAAVIWTRGYLSALTSKLPALETAGER